MNKDSISILNKEELLIMHFFNQTQHFSGMYKKIIIVSQVLFIFALKSNSQEINPPSPNASSLMQYADIPVSYYTGIPNIGIPLYNIYAGNFTLPISLKYHASGIKIAQEASWVGLGWNLNIGGAITRQIRGFDDFGEPGKNGFLSIPPLPQDEYDDIQLAAFFDIGSDGDISLNKDSESDMYFFNFGHYVGKFVFDEDGNAVLLNPEIGLKILNNSKTSWEITDPDGVIYVFGEDYYEETTQYTEPETVYPQTISFPSNSVKTNVTAWYLKEIELLNGEKIEFTYEINQGLNGSKSITYCSHEKRQMIGWAGATHPTDIRTWMYRQTSLSGGDFDKETFNYSANLITRELYLSSISWPNGMLNITTTEREDIEGYNPGYKPKKLSKIEISNTDNVPIKTFNFYYSYFNQDRLGNPDQYLNMRLKLESLQEVNNGESLPKFEFSYNGTLGLTADLPPKNSLSTDYWGYYNGKNTDPDPTDLDIPEFIWQDSYEGEITFDNLDGLVIFGGDFTFEKGKIYHGGDKNCYPEYVDAGILSSLKYPTGGVEEYTFEANSYYNFPTEFIYTDTVVRAYDCKTTTALCETDPNLSNEVIFNITDQQQVTISYSYGDYSRLITDCSSTPTNVFLILDEVDQNGNFLNNVTSYAYDFSELCQEFDPIYVVADQQDLILKEGWFKMSITTIDEFFSNATISFKKKTNEIIPSKYGGGLRIAKITNDGIERFFDYSSSQTFGGNTSGILLSIPNYTYLTKIWGLTESGSLYCSIILNQSSNCTAPLTGLKTGASIGYDRVCEYIIDEQGDKSIKEFTYLNEEVLTIPFFPNCEKYSNGLLDVETYYKGDFNNPVTQITHEYVKDVSSERILKGLRYIKGIGAFYETKSEWYKQSQKESVEYLEGGTKSAQTTYSYNDNNFLVADESTTMDNGDIFTQKTSFSVDFKDVVGSIFPEIVGNNYLIRLPVESIELKNGNVIGSSLTTYKLDNGNYVPGEIQNLVTQAPSFSFSYFDGNIKDVGYSKNRCTYFDHYDEKGNLLEWHSSRGIHTSYIWGYDKKYPVAIAQNALHSEIAFFGFESTYSDNSWSLVGDYTLSTGARTGRYYFQMAGSSSISSNSTYSAGTYKLEYWAKDVIADITITGGNTSDVRASLPDINGWKFFEKTIELSAPSTLTITGVASIDDLRIYPEDSHMSTFTYTPLKGITSQTDPNGLTSFYIYDDLGRLMEIQDSDHYLLKVYDYHYKSQNQ